MKVSRFYDDVGIFLLAKVLKQLRKNLSFCFPQDIATRKCARVMEMLIFLLRREGKYDDPAIFSVSPISLPVDEHYEFNQHRGFFLLISNTYIDHHYSSLGLCIKER